MATDSERVASYGKGLASYLLPQLDVVGGEEPIPALAQPAPPAIVNHLDVGDDVVGVEGDLIIAR